MTTPEQLQAWREEFCTAFNIRLWELQPSGNFSSLGLGCEWAGYLRRCQETEQAMKLAKFGAYILEHTNGGHDFESVELWDTAEHYGLLNQELNAPNEDVEATIKELLK